MAKLPRLLKHFNAYVDGDDWSGKVDSATPPNLAFVMEEHRAGGMNGPIKLEMGMEAMTATLVFSDISPRLYGLLGTDVIPITLRGSVQAQGVGVDPEPVVINMRGRFASLETGEWKPGAKTVLTVTAELEYFRYRQKDVEIVEIDILNMVQSFNGVDQMAKHRANIGM